MDSFDLSFDGDTITGINSRGESTDESKIVKSYPNGEAQSKFEALKLVKEQEIACKNIEDAVENLERRLRILEDEKAKLQEAVEKTRLDSDSKRSVEHCLTKRETNSGDVDLTRHYSYSYTSPIFEDRKSSSAHKTNSSDEENKGLQHDEKDLETPKLMAEAQRPGIQAFEGQRSRRACIFHEKVISNQLAYLMPITNGEKCALNAEESINGGYTINDKSSSEVSGLLLSVDEGKDGYQLRINEPGSKEPFSVNEDKWDNRFCMSDYAPNGFMKIIRQKLAGGKTDNEELPSCVLEQHAKKFLPGRCAQIPAISEKNKLVRKPVREPLVDVQDLSELLCNKLKGLKNEDSETFEADKELLEDSETFEADKELLEGELQRLTDVLYKMAEICQKEGSLFSGSKMDKEYKNEQDVRDLGSMRGYYLNILIEMRKELPCLNQELCIVLNVDKDKNGSIWRTQLSAAFIESESLKISLKPAKEREKDEKKNRTLTKSLENKGKIYAKMTEEPKVDFEINKLRLNHAQQLNAQLANDTSKTDQVQPELHSHYRGLLASLENQLKAADSDKESLKEAADHLAQQLAESEAKATALESSLEEKDKQLEEVLRRMQAIQNEIDATVMEKVDLDTRIQDISKEAEVQMQRNKELVSIVEELLEFAQAKEDQIASLNEETKQLRKSAQEKSECNFKLMEELDGTKKEVKHLRENEYAEAERHRIKELVCINEELLEFAQAKEDQLASLSEEAKQLQKLVQEKTECNSKLMKELDDTRKEVKNLREAEDTFKSRYRFLNLKLLETENDLKQREEALARLTKHLAATIEGLDFIPEEAEQMHISLRDINNKETKLRDQLSQSRKIIEKLMEKLASVELEASKAGMQ